MNFSNRIRERSTGTRNGVDFIVYECSEYGRCTELDHKLTKNGVPLAACATCPILAKCTGKEQHKLTTVERATSLVKTQAKSAVTGLAPQEVIDARLAICEPCEFNKDGKCELCTCPVVKAKGIVNKLSHLSSTCPHDPPKWGPITS